VAVYGGCRLTHAVIPLQLSQPSTRPCRLVNYSRTFKFVLLAWGNCSQHLQPTARLLFPCLPSWMVLGHCSPRTACKDFVKAYVVLSKIAVSTLAASTATHPHEYPSAQCHALLEGTFEPSKGPVVSQDSSLHWFYYGCQSSPFRPWLTN
jgi:hypothetical protein